MKLDFSRKLFSLGLASLFVFGNGSILATSHTYESEKINTARPQESNNEPQTQYSTTGSLFTRDTSNIRLGEAWRNGGLIWGDIVRNPNGSVRRMSLEEATRYCESIGARVPTFADMDWLRRRLGYETEGGYRAQILPNLDQACWFIAASPSLGYDQYFRLPYQYLNTNYDNRAVRCVSGQ